jgi:osmoprotectant transport system permease protein
MRYFISNTDTYILAVEQHILVSLLSVLTAMVIGIPLGILSIRNKFTYSFITGVFNTLRIVPSLAILVLCIPIMGTGVKPAMTALVFLAVPPILINTALAFKSIPDFMLETAAGMGMETSRIFFKVKIPLAMPYILTGIKTATVEVIASATLAAYIGAGGLGTIIFTGIGLFRSDLLFIGGVSVAILSIFASVLLSGVERRLLKYRS